MKKTSKLFVLALCLSAMMASFASAANTQAYTLDELYMEVSIPTDLAVFTRTISADDPNLAIFGLDKASLEEQYQTSNIYLNAAAMDASYEYVVTMTTNEDIVKIFNLDLYDAETIEEMNEGLREEYSKAGYDISDITPYKGSAATYQVLEFTQQSNGTTVYSKQFYTIYNGQAINITLHSYAGELTSELGDELQGIVDSVVFTQTLPTPKDTLALQGGNIFTSYLWVWISGASIGAVVGLISYLVKKNAKKKSAAITSSDNNNI